MVSRSRCQLKQRLCGAGPQHVLVSVDGGGGETGHSPHVGPCKGTHPTGALLTTSSPREAPALSRGVTHHSLRAHRPAQCDIPETVGVGWRPRTKPRGLSGMPRAVFSPFTAHVHVLRGRTVWPFYQLTAL